MSKTGPILILDDDPDDQEIINDAIKATGLLNKLIFFSNGKEALKYLIETTEQPFIIFSDVNLPIMNGLQFREEIDKDEHLRKKSIPFIFFSTSASQASVEKAYE